MDLYFNFSWILCLYSIVMVINKNKMKISRLVECFWFNDCFSLGCCLYLEKFDMLSFIYIEFKVLSNNYFSFYFCFRDFKKKKVYKNYRSILRLCEYFLVICVELLVFRFYLFYNVLGSMERRWI